MIIHQFATQYNIYNRETQINDNMMEHDFFNILERSISFDQGFFYKNHNLLKEIFQILSSNGCLSSTKFRHWHYSFNDNKPSSC